MRSSEAGGETRADGASHRGRSRRRNDGDPVVVHQCLSDAASSYQKAEQPFGRFTKAPQRARREGMRGKC